MYSTVCLKDVMTQRQFDAATASALMRLAYPDDAGRPYIERDNVTCPLTAVPAEWK